MRSWLRILGIGAATACKGGGDSDTVGADCMEIGDLLWEMQNAAEGDVFDLCGGALTQPLEVPVSVELVSSSGGSLQGTADGPVITAAPGITLTIRNLTVVGGGNPGALAGGVDAGQAAALTLEDCVIQGNTGVTGGVLGPAAGPTTLIGTQIVGNSGQTGGLTAGALDMQASTVSGNEGTVYAGGVQVLPTGVVTLDEASAVEGNDAAIYAGGVLLWDRTTWTGGAIRDNSSVQSGGGVVLFSPSDVTLTGVTIEGNQTGGDGGGIQIVPQSAGPVRIQSSTVRDNVAGASGGGINVLPGGHQVIVDATAIDGNTALTGGGVAYGVAAGMLTTMLIQNGSSVSGNTATNGGGLTLDADGTVQVTDSTISGNTATAGGGGGIRLLVGTFMAQVVDFEGNDPDDVWVNAQLYPTMGVDASFVCTSAENSCE